MLKKLLGARRISRAPNGSPTEAGLYSPYAESHVNFLYNLLFCDSVELFRSQTNIEGDDLWSALLADPPDLGALRKIADDETNEGRVRALAYNRLRLAGEQVRSKKIFGIIVEVPQEQGLDVLAAFSEGGVRYLNQSGNVAIFEGTEHPVEKLAKELVAISEPVVNQIGPWDKKRLPPPKFGNARLTFLVSDGLYFGEGPFRMLQQDGMAGPVLAKATELLQRVVDLVTT